jgi:hypothetical protein
MARHSRPPHPWRGGHTTAQNAQRADPLFEITRALVLAGYRVISSAGDELATARAVGLELLAGEVLEAPRRGRRFAAPGVVAGARGPRAGGRAHRRARRGR